MQRRMKRLVTLSIAIGAGLAPARAQRTFDAVYSGTIVEIEDDYSTAPDVSLGMQVTGSFFYEVCAQASSVTGDRYRFDFGAGAMRSELSTGAFCWDITANPGSYSSDVQVDFRPLEQLYVVEMSVGEEDYTCFSGAHSPDYGVVHHSIRVILKDSSSPLTLMNGLYLPTGPSDLDLGAATSMQVEVHSIDASNDDEWTIVVDIDQLTLSGPGLVQSYCVGAPNSVGPGAQIMLRGSLGVADQDLTLLATGCVPNEFGSFFYGPNASFLPFGAGYRCVVGGGIGLFRFLPPAPADAAGMAQWRIDWNAPPVDAGPGRLTPGSTWYFQYWYRDPAFGFNLTDGLRLVLCP